MRHSSLYRRIAEQSATSPFEITVLSENNRTILGQAIAQVLPHDGAPTIDLALDKVTNPDTLLVQIKASITQLISTGGVTSDAVDEDRRNLFTRVQAVLEASAKYMPQALLLIHTPGASSPLKLEPDSPATHPTVKIRQKLFETDLANLPNVQVVSIFHNAPTEAQQPIVDRMTKAKNIHIMRTTQSIFDDPNNIGASIYLKTKDDHIIEFTVRQPQVDAPEQMRAGLKLQETTKPCQAVTHCLEVISAPESEMIHAFFRKK
ncbi:MAG: hypothetical protein O3A01_08615 [bacterium]|nr:hypothetical protein [bacterium]